MRVKVFITLNKVKYYAFFFYMRKMEDSESPTEKLPVHESINVLDYTTLYKSEKWWAAVALCESFGRKDISLYQWQKRDGIWKRQSKWRIKNKGEWLAIKDAVENLIDEI